MSDYLVLRPSQFEDSIEYDVMLPLPSPVHVNVSTQRTVPSPYTNFEEWSLIGFVDANDSRWGMAGIPTPEYFAQDIFEIPELATGFSPLWSFEDAMFTTNPIRSADLL